MSKNINLRFEIESLTVADFWQRKKTNTLTLQPPYQRQAIWPMRAKVSLMETILLGYPIPEIYLAYRTTSEGEQTISVVDGQQRLTALLGFLDNEYALEDLEDEGIRDAFAGNYFRDLPPDVRQEFFQYRFPVRRLSNLDDEFVRAIFARVNRVNMVLTAQELRNALLPGEFYEFLKDCAASELSEKSGVFSGSRRMRGGDLEFFAEVFSSCIFGLSNKRSELDERYDAIASDFDKYQREAHRFLSLLDLASDIIKWQGQVRWSNIVDMFTLLHVFWDSMEEIENLAPEGKQRLSNILSLFQKAVSDSKRESADPQLPIQTIASEVNSSEELVNDAVQNYTLGIRNSSDLGSRRKRSQNLLKLVKLALVKTS